MRSRIVAAAALGLFALSCGSSPEPARKAETKKQALPKTPPEKFRVKLDTSKGPIVIQLARANAPKGVDHFYRLLSTGYYDNVRFHRVMRGFIAQFGISGIPLENQVWATAKIPDDPVKLKNKRGTVTFAKIGPNSRTTQLFINLRDNLDLDASGFAPIGEVAEGMDVADKLAFLYGENKPRGSGPDPNRIQTEGNSYLEKEFPRLDFIKKATVILE